MGGVRSHCHASGRRWWRWSSPCSGGQARRCRSSRWCSSWRRSRSRCRSCDRRRVCRASTTSRPTPTSPPRFVSVVPLRAGAPNPVEYGGPEIAAQQRQGYPDLQPLSLPLPPNQAFDRALATARMMGWEIVASDPPSGRIEATDTTFWFGFKDDVVIRVAPAPNGSRVDVRSLVPRRAERRGHQRRPHPQVPRGAQRRDVTAASRGAT